MAVTPGPPAQLPTPGPPLPRVPPAIDSVVPSKFRADTPTQIIISGVGLYPVTKVTVVFANGTRADAAELTAAAAGDRVVCTTPAGTPGQADLVVSLFGGGNLLTANQASLEDGNTVGWQAGGVSGTTIDAVADFAQSGIYSLRIRRVNGANFVYAELDGLVEIVPGVGYAAGGWFSPYPGTPAAGIYVQLGWYNAGGAYISHVQVDGVESADGWTQLTAVGVAPANATYARAPVAGVTAAEVAVGGEHCFDALTLTRSTGSDDVIAAGALTLERPPPGPRPPPTGPYCDTPATLRLERLDPAGAVVETLDLMDVAGGYRVASFDLAFPDPREVTAALPTRDGDYDTTRLLGPRAVTVAGSLVASLSATRQAAAEALAYWCQPRLRPRLVYALDPGEVAKTLTLRGAALSGPHTNRSVTRFSASWVAPDPIAHGLDLHPATIGPQALDVGGTEFDITFDLRFPLLEGGSGIGTVDNAGTYPAWPLLRIYGPCTGPALYWQPPASGAVVLADDFAIAGGDYLEVDTFTQTVRLNGQPGASRYDRLDFSQTRWAGLEPGATRLRFAPRAFAAPCQCWVGWWDAWI